ncbi:hypothetical protein BZA05DRAFT_438315 [Tricharina praecox]|uniref:uncharacterized protein n=1 Tax=Tricharina praecox TaxID=43433 RepID=UPI00221EBFEC|nr:uncharacterized protein BZA05DRAFT_438315 [Tricharina praecox]KAI5846105.1 hypothetical protein BZA05DRAFT_438315 [Tricharina praecox]
MFPYGQLPQDRQQQQQQQQQQHDHYQNTYQQPVWLAGSNGSPQRYTHNPSPHDSGYFPPNSAHHYQPPHISHQHRGSDEDYIAYSPRDSGPSPSYAAHPQADGSKPRRTTSVATHTTFRVNGMHYRPAGRRHVSEDISAMDSVPETPMSPARNRPQPSRLSPARRQSPVPPQQSHGPGSPHSPTASFASSARSSSSPWGYLFAHAPVPQEPPVATHKLHRLLTSIATYLSAQPPATEAIITRDKLAHYYGAFSPHPDLDHRAAYISTATNRGLARLWTWLGCKYYLVPARDGGEPKPALTITGFVAWSTVQLLLCPDLEVGVISSLLKAVELRDPETPNICWPRGLDRDAVGGVDPIAGERWSRWWSVLLQPDDEEEIDVLRRQVAELEEELLGRRRRQRSSDNGGVPSDPAPGIVEVWDRAEAETGLAEKPERNSGQNEEIEKQIRELVKDKDACGQCGKRGWCGCRETEAELGVDGRDMVETREMLLEGRH